MSSKFVSKLPSSPSSDSDLDENNNYKSILSTPPRIYYGIRTHKQITQVIRELRKTSYDDGSIRVCILSGRERACINDSIRQLPTRDEKCHELVSARQAEMKFSIKRTKRRETCRFYCDSRSVARTFQTLGNNTKVWDIEDALDFGRKNSACPYYGMRALHERATITFCPYNYLIDPTIRKGLEIELKNAVVIFDEAHNIDDICRSSASFIVSLRQITDLTRTIANLVTYYERKGQVNVVNAFNYFDKIFKSIGDLLNGTQFDSQLRESSISLSQDEMLIKLHALGLGRDCVLILKNHLKNLSYLTSTNIEADYDGSNNDGPTRSQEHKPPPRLDSDGTRLINQLATTIDLMYATGDLSTSSSIDDFRLVLCRSIDTQAGGVISRGLAAVGIISGKLVKEFKLFCMNPALIFRQVHESAWSVVVASGTLAPISSFKTELGCQFSNIFEGSHVVKGENIFASIIATGPNNLPLNACYTNSLQPIFQDELGNIVGDICATVPNGVLCFFPSYDRLSKFFGRWQQRGLMTIDMELKSRKRIIQEQKNLSPSEFERSLASYYRYANSSDGALLLAVYRGKASEGINFADKAARAVITIGIPYPNFGEMSIALKRAYNDMARLSNPGLMSGREWYEAQAFRPLNQALGRCIRHRADWGAILMLDSRLQSNGARNNITKWIRANIIDETNHNLVIKKLHQFVASRHSIDD